MQHFFQALTKNYGLRKMQFSDIKHLGFEFTLDISVNTNTY
jgi:hypothetical protein